MPRYATALVILSYSICTLGWAQDEAKEKVNFPQADIFLFELTNEDGKLNVGNGRNVTARPGYENQPFFVADSSSFLFSRSDDYQTDIYEYFIATGDIKQITSTEISEFSPQPSPDNQTISFVTDGEKANLSVCHVRRDDSNPTWTLNNQTEREPIGYYSWNHETGFILFWSRYGFNVRLVHESKPVSHYVSGNAVPTSPHIIPGTKNFSFLHRQGNGQVWIKELDPETLAVRPLTPVVGNNTHYGWTPEGAIVMVEGSVLHLWRPGSDTGWQRVADLKSQGLGSATRIAVSPNGKWLAVVGLPLNTRTNEED